MKKLLMCATVSAMLTAGSSLGAQAGGPPPKVSTGKVVTVTENGMRKYVGQAAAIEEVQLKARVSGYLEKVNFREGELVKKGDLLFEIEDTTYLAAVKSAEAKLAQKKTELDYASKYYARQKRLSESKVVSDSDMDQAVRDINLARAGVTDAEAALIDARNNLSYTKIYAPVSGRIGKSTYSVGNYLSLSSKDLAEIVQIAPIYVKFSISEPDYLEMFNGTHKELKSSAIVRLRTSARTAYPETGKVTLVDNRIDSQTGTLMMWALFPNKDEHLVPGALLDVILTRKASEQLPAVKISAVMIGKAGHYVYVLGKGNSVESRAVTVGEQIGEYQVIKSGLKPGETVITDGTHKTRPGGMVVPMPEKTASNASVLK